eukprot:1522766-Pyramimonas_sp.AAC.1
MHPQFGRLQALSFRKPPPMPTSPLPPVCLVAACEPPTWLHDVLDSARRAATVGDFERVQDSVDL